MAAVLLNKYGAGASRLAAAETSEVTSVVVVAARAPEETGKAAEVGTARG